MKAIIKNRNFNFTLNNSNHKDWTKQKQAGTGKFERAKIYNEYNINRPAQALSFGGSLNSNAVDMAQDVVSKTSDKIKTQLGDKIASDFTQSGIANKMIAFTADNEVAFNAIYSMLFAGIIKPICVLNQKGSDEKDKQYIATKNFLQAFIGSFLSLTIGGGIMKKITDTVTNNLKLMKKELKNPDALKPNTKYAINLVDENDKNVGEIAKKLLNKQYSSFSSKIKLAKETTEGLSGFEKIKQFIKDLKKGVSVDYENNNIIRTFKQNGTKVTEVLEGHNVADELKQKSKDVYKTAKEHLGIFNKHSDYVARLIDSMNDKETKVTLYDSFQTVVKRSTEVVTAILKSKIASVLLPTVVAFLFADGAIKGSKKAKENKENKQKQANLQNSSMLLNSKTFKEENNRFKSLLNKQDNASSNSAINIPFKGNIASIGAKKAGNLATKAIEHIFLSKAGEKFAQFLIDLKPPANKPSARMGDIESILITGYWVLNTTLSKKIEPSQKLGLNIHTILVTVVSSISAFLIDTAFDGAIDKAGFKYSQIIKNAYNEASKTAKDSPEEFTRIVKENTSKLFNSSEIEKQITSNLSESDLNKIVRELSGNYSKKLSKFKSLIIFTFVVRFLVPVALVPFSGKIKKFIEKKFKAKQKDNEADKVK